MKGRDEMKDLIQELNCAFTDEEKAQCEEVIGWMVEYVNNARRWGLLGLEKELETIQTDVLKEGLRMVIDCEDKDKRKQTMRDIIIKGEYTGYELLKRIIMAEGLLLLANGVHPVDMAKELSAILGEEYTAPVAAAEAANEGMIAYFALRKRIADREDGAVYEDFFGTVEEEHDDYAWYLFDLVDVKDCICALHGCSKRTIRSRIDYAPLERCFEICTRWDEAGEPSEEEMLEAGKRVVEDARAKMFALIENLAADELAQVKQIIGHHFGKDESEIAVSSALVADLGIKPLDMILFTAAIEEAFELVIADDDANDWKTVGDIVRYIVDSRGE